MYNLPFAPPLDVFAGLVLNNYAASFLIRITQKNMMNLNSN